MTVSPTATPRAADGTKWVAISTRPSVSAPQRCLSLPSHRIAVPGGTGQAAASQAALRLQLPAALLLLRVHENGSNCAALSSAERSRAGPAGVGSRIRLAGGGPVVLAVALAALPFAQFRPTFHRLSSRPCCVPLAVVAMMHGLTDRSRAVDGKPTSLADLGVVQKKSKFGTSHTADDRPRLVSTWRAQATTGSGWTTTGRRAAPASTARSTALRVRRCPAAAPRSPATHTCCC